jgi:Na+/H+ antiporter
VALAIALIAKRTGRPYPIALVGGGFAIASLPGVPAVQLDPSFVFLLLLPPILFEAAYFTSWRDFLRWRRPILMLAFGLVTVTSFVVAALCVWLIPGMSWAAGFTLGAIISPPDAAAATAITRGMRLPRRITQILEGESLVNDAAALTIYRFSVAAIMTGAFSISEAAISFVWIAVGGVAIGLALGWVYVKLYPYLKDAETEILSTFILGYVAYFLAEQVHASGVLATVTAGVILGQHAPQIFSAATRIRGTAVWQVAIFLINVTIFFLIGLQLPRVLRRLAGYPPENLLFWCVAISLGVIVLRMAWVFPSAYLPRLLSSSVRAREPYPAWQQVTVVGWTGLRGVVSLAAALALPLETERGLPFPYRDLINLLTVAAILATLIVQGLTLRPLVRWLGVPQDRSMEEEELEGRIHAADKVIERIIQMEEEGRVPPAVLERVRGFFEDRLTELRARAAAETEQPDEFQSLTEQRVWWELARVERLALLDLRRRHKISDEAMREIEHDIDLLEARIVPRG